jgi:hypothetical protein
VVFVKCAKFVRHEGALAQIRFGIAWDLGGLFGKLNQNRLEFVSNMSEIGSVHTRFVKRTSIRLGI